MTQYANDSLALHTDLYEINMILTHWQKGNANRQAVFEMYFRDNPFGMGYAIFTGLERLIDYIENLHFSKSDIDYLRDSQEYPEEFLDYLANWHFKGSIRSYKEGEVAFANEPLIQVEGPIVDCQLIETALLNIVNFQTLIATKAAQIKTVAQEDSVLEFGSRRAQEVDASVWGARATYIGGCDATSNVLAGKRFGIPIAGTHAHALIQAYRDEVEAFRAYAETHRDCIFLVDTYNTLDSGVPNAIQVAREFGDKINFKGVRLDSGDLSYLSKRVRQQLDEAGFKEAKIYASSDLDSSTILNLKMQGAKIDVWGVGTKLITAYDQPALGGVYKLVSIQGNDGQMHHTLKLTGDADKISTPGKKQVYRIHSQQGRKPEGDYITFDNEKIDEKGDLFMFHPKHPYINKTVKDFKARPLLHDIYIEGELVYDKPDLEGIRAYSEQSLDEFYEEYKRVLNPENYPVDLSEDLFNAKMETIKEFRHQAQSKETRKVFDAKEKGEA